MEGGTILMAAVTQNCCIGVFCILLAAAAFLAGRYYGLKKQLKSVAEQLADEQNRLVTVALTDRDLEAVASGINGLLEKVQQTIIRSNAASAALKSSIADISHDMKTPLTSVIGYLQLAGRECSDDKTKELIKICLERAQYCNTLINDFFELSLLESQGCVPKPERVDVAGMICEQILAHCPVFEEKGITPHFKNADRAVMALADPALLNRVIGNLISNGVKYTSGDIFFDVRQEDGRVVITVSNPVDTYVDAERIFDRFYTQDRSRNRGSGIGLYICRQFIESMGGSINAAMDGTSLAIEAVLRGCGRTE